MQQRDLELFTCTLLKVQLGEELLAQGEIETGVEHLSNAVAVCGQPQQVYFTKLLQYMLNLLPFLFPQQLLQVLQQTLPPQVFRLLLERLPIVGQVCCLQQIMLLHS